MDNTREKLIEVKNTLEMCYKQGLTSECTGCTYREHNNVCMDALMEDALAVIKCLEEKQATSNESKWIPVTERLPELGKYVMVYGNRGGIYTAYLSRYWPDSDYIAWHKLNSKNHHCEPTHWMPLPEPPKGDSV